MASHRRHRLAYIVLFLCVGLLAVLAPASFAQAQTYSVVWATNVDASPNPMLSGVDSSIITIDTMEFAQWYWLEPTNMTTPMVFIEVAGKWIYADVSPVSMSPIGFWGGLFNWWFTQTGTWTHQAVWDGTDLQGNLVPAGSYPAIVHIFAGAAQSQSFISIDVEQPLDINIISPGDNAIIALNADTVFVAKVAPVQYIDQISWAGGEIPSTGIGGTFTTKFTSAGVKTVTASVTNGAQSDTDTIQVQVLALDYILINPINIKTPPAKTYEITAIGYNNGPNGVPEQGGGDDIPLYITPSWSISGGIGTVSPIVDTDRAVFSAIDSLPQGQDVILGSVTATAAGVSGTADVQVYEPRPEKILISPAQTTILTGEHATFTSEVYDQEGRLWDSGGLSYQWYLNDVILDGETTLTLDYLFDTRGKFKVQLDVTYKGQTAQGKADVEVLDSVQVEICEGQIIVAGKTVCPTPGEYVCLGTTKQFSYLGLPPGGDGVWNSSSPEIAAITSDTGIINTTAKGQTDINIAYSYGGQTASSALQLNVINAEFEILSLDPTIVTGGDSINYDFRALTTGSNIQRIRVELLNGQQVLDSAETTNLSNRTNPRVISNLNNKTFKPLSVPGSIADNSQLTFRITASLTCGEEYTYTAGIDVNDSAVALARVLCAESNDPTGLGQRAVAATMTNREGFTFSNYEFSRQALGVPVSGSYVERILSIAYSGAYAPPESLSNTSQVCRDVAESTLDAALQDPTSGAIYFYTTGAGEPGNVIVRIVNDLIACGALQAAGGFSGNSFFSAVPPLPRDLSTCTVRDR